MGTGYQTNSYTLVWKHSNLKYAVPCIGLVLMSAKKYKRVSVIVFFGSKETAALRNLKRHYQFLDHIHSQNREH